MLGVAGGIAAYKAAALCSALVQRGDEVDVVMTEGALRFVGAATFAALSGRAVLASLWDAPETIPHVALSHAADVVAIVPATANVLAKLAHGIADDALANVALATRAPLVVAPAMNTAMYEHPATRANLATLLARGVYVVPPESGFLAERERGVGRLAAQDAIVAAIDAALARRDALAGQRVLVTAGPTREAIDPVRFLSNASTGTMGVELARAAIERGAEVDLVLGPSAVDVPAGVRVARVTTAQQMYDAVVDRAPGATLAFAAAAVADFRPAHVYERKVHKGDASETLALERTPDILAALGAAKGATYLVGFAAETDDHEASARRKLAGKHLDAIAVNDVSSPDVGFGAGDNELVVLFATGERIELGRASKRELAGRLVDAVGAARARTSHG